MENDNRRKDRKKEKSVTATRNTRFRQNWRKHFEFKQGPAVLCHKTPTIRRDAKYMARELAIHKPNFGVIKLFYG